MLPFALILKAGVCVVISGHVHIIAYGHYGNVLKAVFVVGAVKSRSACTDKGIAVGLIFGQERIVDICTDKSVFRFYLYVVGNRAVKALYLSVCLVGFVCFQLPASVLEKLYPVAAVSVAGKGVSETCTNVICPLVLGGVKGCVYGNTLVIPPVIAKICNRVGCPAPFLCLYILGYLLNKGIAAVCALNLKCAALIGGVSGSISS